MHCLFKATRYFVSLTKSFMKRNSSPVIQVCFNLEMRSSWKTSQSHFFFFKKYTMKCKSHMKRCFYSMVNWWRVIVTRASRFKSSLILEDKVIFVKTSNISLHNRHSFIFPHVRSSDIFKNWDDFLKHCTFWTWR